MIFDYVVAYMFVWFIQKCREAEHISELENKQIRSKL